MIRVTDHALIRFLERSGAMQFDTLRAAIAASLERAAAAAELLGSTDCVIVADGLKYVIEDGILVTVLDQDMRVRRRRR